MINYFSISDDSQINKANDELSANWIHIEKPTSEDIERFTKRYHFPHDYLSAVLDNQEISRYEGFKQPLLDRPLLLLLQYPKIVMSPSGFKQIEALPFSIIITRDKVITSCNDTLELGANLLKGKAFLSKIDTKEKLAIQLAWHFSDLFNYYIKAIKTETDGLESELQKSTENKQLFQLMDMQKSLVYFDSALEQNLIVIEKAYESTIMMTSKDSMTALYDIMIETKQALASAKIQAELLSQLGNLFSAIVSNNMNIVMKVLTVITIVLTIPTIIGGVYGMNVELPFAQEKNAFWWLVILTILFSLITFWILKKKKFF
ncbi:magnesium transporter CorA family protein [Vagococcus sp. BWB3-3]|uniref:Magnesium transporter CorA family protein n=1 Tax=Vagococcus allomyrinae TaxID=2794353 RepID=A0A940SVX9_9ENTE|nr:magnesium transporter CorA family protein [Vagococcus allomyrinae]